MFSAFSTGLRLGKMPLTDPGFLAFLKKEADEGARAARPGPERTVELSSRHRGVAVDRARLTALVEQLDKHAARFKGGAPKGELSIVILTDKAIAKIHGDFMDDPTATDVITFEGQPELGSAGEICVSADTAARYAAEHGRAFSEELSLYVIHGWLHLAGYDDLQPELKRAMRRAEARAEKILRPLGLLEGFSLKRQTGRSGSTSPRRVRR